MVLTVNIGNSTIALAVYVTAGEQRISTSISTDARLTRDELVVKLAEALRLYSVEAGSIEGVIISSVVPPMTAAITEAVWTLTEKKPLVVGPGLKSGVKINIDFPNELGADIVALAAGALAKYEPPLILVDFGTATTVSAIDKSGCYQGCAICPGVKLSYDALSTQTAQLPRIAIGEVSEVIGKSSVASMHSGLIYGFASMVDGMVERFEAEIGKCAVVATGRLAPSIKQYCKHDILFDQTLIADGLYNIHMRNTQKRAK